jgi:hypothetical protein
VIEAAERRDFQERRVEPPVDEVEVMGGLVDPERAAPLAQPVPAAEVVGAVLGVEIPGEVHGGDPPDRAREQYLLDLLVLRGSGS